MSDQELGGRTPSQYKKWRSSPVTVTVNTLSLLTLHAKVKVKFIEEMCADSPSESVPARVKRLKAAVRLAEKALGEELRE